MPTVRFWPPGGGGTAVLFRTAFGGKVGMEEACCCPEEDCSHCANNAALSQYNLDLSGVAAICCTQAAGWDGTYVVDWDPPPTAALPVGCAAPGGGVQCNGDCDGVEFTVASTTEKCRWTKNVPDTPCVPSGVGNTGVFTMAIALWLVQSPSDSKYYWYCTISIDYQQATNCGANQVHFISDPLDNKPNCLSVNETLNYLCHSWSGAGVRAADFSGATVVLTS